MDDMKSRYKGGGRGGSAEHVRGVLHREGGMQRDDADQVQHVGQLDLALRHVVQLHNHGLAFLVGYGQVEI